MTRFSLHFFFLFAVNAAFAPYMSSFLLARGFSTPQMGMLMGCMELAGVFGPIVLGHFADRLGLRRSTLVVSLLALAAGMTVLNGVSDVLSAVMLVMLVGLGYKTALPMADALACSELKDPTHQYGRSRAFGSLGFILALVVIRAGGLVNETDSTSMLTPILLTMVVCLLTAVLLPDHHRRRLQSDPARGPSGIDRSFWLFMVPLFMARFGLTAHYTFLVPYGRDVLHMQSAAWLWAVGSAAELPVIYFAGRLLKRSSLVGMMVISTTAVSIRLAIYAATGSLAVIVASQVLHALCYGLMHCTTIEFINRRVAKPGRGLAMTLYMTVGMGLPAWSANIAGGWLVNLYGYRTMFLLYAIVPLVGVACLMAWRKTLRTEPPTGEEPASAAPEPLACDQADQPT